MKTDHVFNISIINLTANEVENNEEVSREMREKMGHQHFSEDNHEETRNSEPHGFDAASRSKHSRMIAAIEDCQVIIAGGMGRGALVSMQEAGKEVYVVSDNEIETALAAFIAGTLDRSSGFVH